MFPPFCSHRFGSTEVNRSARTVAEEKHSTCSVTRWNRRQDHRLAQLSVIALGILLRTIGTDIKVTQDLLR
jgi:hypothetical protein